ncbi:MAG TPA: YciC family protein [Armatimonadota bacterium]|nr:YciC family protein [Armatimonadota bacterium]HUV05837.1 YciC family protein [Armatimonadota bacterium]
MAQRILRPLDYGGLFDELFDLYKRNLVLFMGIGALIYLPTNLLIILLMTSMQGGVMKPGQMPSPPLIVGLILIGLLSIPLSYAASAAMAWAVSSTYLGNRPTILGSYKAILPRLVPFMLTALLTVVMYGLGFVLCCIPGIALTILLAFVPVVLVIEDHRYMDAIKRSWALAKSDWVRVLVVLIISAVLGGILQMILTTPFQILTMFKQGEPGNIGPLTIVQAVMSGVAATLVLPITTIAIVLLYYDIRIRKEGFDIQMLAHDMGLAPGQPVQP